ncbi:MAG: TRAP transporter large permease subunit, partial [Rhodobiaceae bacterium]|nr:TRAP transporter large permease subunit [Rhodobiaceae bacterium]
QMLRLGYNRNLAIGTICASGSLGTMIPPSIVLIFYGLITDTSIHALFKAAFVPGFILAGCYIAYIIIRTRLNPALAPLPESTPDDMSSKEKMIYGTALLAMVGAGWYALMLLRAGFLIVLERVDADTTHIEPEYLTKAAIICALLLAYLAFFVRPANIRNAWAAGKGLLAPLLVVFVVLGSIYGGVTGITEAAGMGTVAVLILIIIRGEFSLELVRDSLMRTFKSTGTIIWVTFGATALAGAYTIAGGPTYVANLIVGAELPTLGILLVMMVIFLFLGAFMDWVGIVLLVMPVFLPIVLKLPVEELGLFGPLTDSRSFVSVWFGILFCVNMQVSFLSPPFGPAAFYLKSVAPPHIQLPDIFRGFLPFIGMQLFVLTLILFFPELTMFFRGE